MTTQMGTEICCSSPAKASYVTEELRANGFTVETLDWTDPEGGPHVWLVASASTELSADAFFAWVHTLVDEPSVFIVEGGPLASIREAIAERS
jgi:hypothetical protein